MLHARMVIDRIGHKGPHRAQTLPEYNDKVVGNKVTVLPNVPHAL